MDMSLSTNETVLLEEGQESGGEYLLAGHGREKGHQSRGLFGD